jgi:hypothetical protein
MNNNPSLLIFIILSFCLGTALGIVYQRNINLRKELQAEKEEEPEKVIETRYLITPHPYHGPWPHRRKAGRWHRH